MLYSIAYYNKHQYYKNTYNLYNIPLHLKAALTSCVTRQMKTARDLLHQVGIHL